MKVNRDVIEQFFTSLPAETQSRVASAQNVIVKAKERGKNVVAAIGSGPNLHEGVTTLIAELMHKGIIDGVTTSSAVISHEMAGTLDRVKRVDSNLLGLPEDKNNLFGVFEATIIEPDALQSLQQEMALDTDFYQRVVSAEGSEIIKAAGNMAYPMGLRTELLAMEILKLCQELQLPFEEIAGRGADKQTMLGAGAQLDIPVLVTVPQLVGGGKVGFAVGDSIPISERSTRIAQLLNSADVIIESAIALTQEIHDGPLETFTGHGMWSDWQGEWTYSLREKSVIRIDLDPNLERIWHKERVGHEISNAVTQGLPKTKVTGVPFRMEMSGFSRLPDSLPIIGDIGTIWPILALRVADSLGISLDFMSYNQSLKEGIEMREWIVKNIAPLDRHKIFS